MNLTGASFINADPGVGPVTTNGHFSSFTVCMSLAFKYLATLQQMRQRRADDDLHMHMHTVELSNLVLSVHLSECQRQNCHMNNQPRDPYLRTYAVLLSTCDPHVGHYKETVRLLCACAHVHTKYTCVLDKRIVLLTIHVLPEEV